MAKITNNALSPLVSGKTPGQGLAFYIAQLWKTIVVVGSLAFLLYLVWGGIEWLTSAGDKTKVESAQSKITSAVIGLAILVVSYAIILFIQAVFKINILKPEFPSV
jgi:TRAP-type C4-dicarboxylate transport system permease small subunit